MSFTPEAVSTVAQVALGAALAYGYNIARRYYLNRRPASRIWGLHNAAPDHIITAQDDTEVDDEYTVKVYPAEYLAAVEVRSLLAETLGRKSVTLSTSAEFSTARSLGQNLICIGGPVHNRITAILLERLQLPFHFDGHSLVSHVSNQRYDAAIDRTTGKITRDIGVVAIAQNPFQRGSRVVLLIGCRTFGCAAASRFVTQGALRETNRMLGPTYPKWAILDVDVVDDFVARVTAAEAGGELERVTS